MTGQTGYLDSLSGVRARWTVAHLFGIQVNLYTTSLACVAGDREILESVGVEIHFSVPFLPELF